MQLYELQKQLCLGVNSQVTLAEKEVHSDDETREGRQTACLIVNSL